MSKVSKMEKADVEIMEPYADGTGYHPVTIVKNLWKCNECGLVWRMRYQARECFQRNHESSYTLVYGGYFENDRHVGGHEVRLHAVRKDNVVVGEQK